MSSSEPTPALANARPASLKTLYVKTYGCQMNVYDSERMTQLLGHHGYKLVDNPSDANVSLINTCHIREKATEKVFSEVGRLKKHKMGKKAGGEEGLIVVTGCVAQAEGEEIMRRAPYVDVVVGPQVYHRLPELLEQARRRQALARDPAAVSQLPKAVDTSFPLESKFDALPLSDGQTSVSAFLSIQEGCDKFCTYCVVPYTRGAEYSRPVKDILAEARHLTKQGVKEITLLGQNVNAYHGRSPSGSGEWGLGALCHELATIPELLRIRYTTSHPQDMDPELIKAHGECTKLMPFLHLPVQSGSNRVLQSMNRKHTVGTYLEILSQLRKQRPDIAFSSDFIVGFPGESDKDFEDTLQLLHQVRYAYAFSFAYSARPGTPAAALDMQVPAPVQAQRLQRLQTVLNEHQMAFNKSFVGKTLDVLFEKKGTQPFQFMGKSPYMHSVYLSLPLTPGGHNRECDIIGKVRKVKIVAAEIKALHGVLSSETHI